MEKKIIFSVKGKTISETCPLHWSSNTVDYIKAGFVLDDEWKSCDVVRAAWSGRQGTIITLLDADDSCVVPHEVLAVYGKVSVNLYGVKYDDDGEEFTRITTAPVTAIIIDSTARIDGSETAPITPSQFEQFVQAVKTETEKVTGMTAVAETLPAGSDATASYSDGVLALGIPRGNKGDTGPAGPQGERGLQGIQGERGLTGPAGPQGERGERGLTGETGPAGPAGSTGPQGPAGRDGSNGADGFSPTATVTKTGDTATITITDKNGTTTATMTDREAEITDLKNALPQTYVALKGENQLQPQNIAGVTFTKEEGEVYGEDIFSESYLGENGYYASVNANVTPPILAHSVSSAYRWYAIPVDGGSKYTFTQARFACLAKGKTIGSETIGTTISNASEVTTTAETTFLILSYHSSVTAIEIHKVTVGYVYSNFVMPSWMKNSASDKKPNASVTGDIASGGNLQLTAPKNNLRKGERIVFEGNISSFDSLRIGLSFGTNVATDGNQMNTFRIDGTNISYYARSNSTPVTVAHGLTLANNIQIIWEMSEEASLKLTLISNGNMFTNVFSNFIRQTIGNPFVLSVGTVLTECKLTWTCTDIDKDIWMFGDSYFAYSRQRWTYYLHQFGYDQNCLLDGFSGMGGVNGRVSFNNLLNYGTPKIAVWCLGMNDGTDSDSAPSANWVSARNYFLKYCTDNNITPMFGTIPTVPTINHEQKNAWIRSSGYRYIDFAKAVGASASGTWFSGMLSSDGIHPDETGAKALFARVLLDLPEIMLSE